MKRAAFPPAYLPLLAVHPVLALAAENLSEIRLPHDLFVPLASSLVLVVLAWTFACGIAPDRDRRGAIAVLLVVFVEWYGWLVRGIAPLEGGADHRVMLPLWAGWLLLIGVLAWRLAPRLAGAHRYLNVAAAALVVFALFPIFDHALLHASSPAKRVRSTGAAPAAGEARPPDIFFIVLDKYTGSTSLKRSYGWDNAAFEHALEREGFIIPKDSHANYIHTHLSLASILNWTYLDEIPRRLGKDSKDPFVAYRWAENNRAWDFLRQRGYRYVFMPSAFGVTSRNRNADVTLAPELNAPSEFTATWLRSTVLFPLQEVACAETGALCVLPYGAFYSESAAVTDWKFRALESLRPSEAPLFVFAHLLVPHEPYVYRSDCRHRPPFWPLDDRGPDSAAAKAAYIAQIRCTNRKLLHLVGALKKRPGPQPIILLQADHGHGRIAIDYSKGINRSLEELSPTDIEERTNVFAAYYLPGKNVDAIPDDVSAINVLPRVFNLYFDARLPLQPRATYWSTWQRPYDFVRVR